MTTTKRSLDMLRADGWLCGVVEQRIPHTFITRDLFGFIDIVAIRGRETLGVQTTTSAHVNARIKKIKAHREWLKGREIHVHGWSKKGARGERKTWQCRVIAI